MTRGTDIRAWTYEADIHCPACARARFGSQVTDAPWPDQTTTDSEGNPPHPVFETDERPDIGECCGTCGTEISPAYEQH
jgi:hypothetical protein